MNKEIKEILDYLKDENEYYDEEEQVTLNYGELVVEKEDIDKLLNYITNLQEENQKLNKIIDNAIDYIYKNSFDKEEPTKLWFRVFKRDLHGHAQKLLDILKKMR